MRYTTMNDAAEAMRKDAGSGVTHILRRGGYYCLATEEEATVLLTQGYRVSAKLHRAGFLLYCCESLNGFVTIPD